MSSKEALNFVCNNCGNRVFRWQGKCFNCGAFNSFIEEQVPTTISKSSTHKHVHLQTKPLNTVIYQNNYRIPTSHKQIDELLEGGLIPGQLILLAGEPGVGKSTLLLQVMENLPCLYVCGEESAMQIKLRAERLKINTDKFEMIEETDVDIITDFLTENNSPHKNKVLIVDSIQSVFSSQIKSIPGSISQIQYCATLLREVAKKHGYTVILVGQITKDGYIAGPKVLEHIVDTVLFFEGDKRGNLRILRVVKNRFGSSNKVEIFIMDTNGLLPADTYLKSLIAERVIKSSGSALAIMFEGNRPLIIEIQALNAPSQYGISRRIVNGISGKRVEMLLAVLQRRVGISSNQFDIYINISGGLKVIEPGCDLAVMLAVVSVLKNKPLPKDMIALGEVGLLGEIKPINRHQDAIKEATKHGYLKIIDYRYANNVRDLIKKIFI